MKKVFTRIFFILIGLFLFLSICFSAEILPVLSLFGSVKTQPFRASIKDSAKTHVMILGTPHLQSLGDHFKPSLLDNLLDVLERFKPDLIGVESIPPFLLEDMELRKDKFADVINQFAKLRIEYGHKMQQNLKISRQKAEDIAHSLFLALRDEPKSYDKRAELVQCLLASYDDVSALLQWSYLPEAFRSRYKDIPDNIHDYINDQLESSNEIISIGISIAKRLGLDRIEYVDDHHDKEIFLKIASKLMAEIQNNSEYLSVQNDSFYKKSQQRLQDAVKKGDLLPYYIYMNSLEYEARDMELQWNLWFRTKLQSGLDRSRMALWEVRNLNISSHIRRATALHPGERLLVIIGASHKPFLETYLNQMVDIKLVQLRDVSSNIN